MLFTGNSKPGLLKYSAACLIQMVILATLISVIHPHGDGLSGEYIKGHPVEVILIGIVTAGAVRIAVVLYDKFQGYDSR
jgi:hypothetical protein